MFIRAGGPGPSVGQPMSGALFGSRMGTRWVGGTMETWQGFGNDNAMDSLHQLHTAYSTSAQRDSILHIISQFRRPLDLAPAIQANARPPIGFPPESDHPGAKARQGRDGLAPPGQLCAAGTTESGNRDISLRAIYIRTGCRRQPRRATHCGVQTTTTFRLNCQVPSPARNKCRQPHRVMNARG